MIASHYRSEAHKLADQMLLTAEMLAARCSLLAELTEDDQLASSVARRAQGQAVELAGMLASLEASFRNQPLPSGVLT